MKEKNVDDHESCASSTVQVEWADEPPAYRNCQSRGGGGDGV